LNSNCSHFWLIFSFFSPWDDVSLTINEDTGKLYVVGVDSVTKRKQRPRNISKKDAMKLFSLTQQQLSDIIAGAAHNSASSVHPMNEVPGNEIPDAEVYNDPYYVGPLPKARLVMPDQDGSGFGPATPRGNYEEIAALRDKIHKKEVKEAMRRATYNQRRRNKRRAEKEQKGKGQSEVDKISEALQQAKISPKPKQRKEEYRTGVYRGPTAKERKSRKSPQKGGFSPAMIPGIGEALGKAAEGVHGTFQKGIDALDKQSERGFQKNQLTGWYDRKGARNDRRQGVRNMKQLVNNFDYLEQELNKERGNNLSREQLFALADAFRRGG